MLRTLGSRMYFPEELSRYVALKYYVKPWNGVDLGM